MATLEFWNMPTPQTPVPDLLFGDFTQSEVQSIIKQSVIHQDGGESPPVSFGSFSSEEVSELVTSSHDLKNVVDFEFEEIRKGEEQEEEMAVDVVPSQDTKPPLDNGVGKKITILMREPPASSPAVEIPEMPAAAEMEDGEEVGRISQMFPSLQLSDTLSNLSTLPTLSTPDKADIDDVMSRLIEEAVKTSAFQPPIPPENNFASPAPAWSTAPPELPWSDGQFFGTTTVANQPHQSEIWGPKPVNPVAPASVWSNNHHQWASLSNSLFKSEPSPVIHSTPPASQPLPPSPKVPLPQILAENRPITSKDHDLMMLGSQLRHMTISPAEPVPVIPRGLVNKSTNCFAHAPLQALLVSPLYHVITQLSPAYTVSPVLSAVKTFFDSFNAAKGVLTKFDAPFEPTSIYEMLRSKIPSFNENGRQEDAEEFLGIILSNLHDEMVSAIRSAKGTASRGVTPSHPPLPTPEELAEDDEEGEWQQIGRKNRVQVTRNTSNHEVSPVSELFGGLTRSVVTKAGAKESATLQPFLSLQLDIQNPGIASVEDALRHFTHREQITLASAKGYRRETLEALPPVLILHLKRFIYDEAAKSCQKLHKEIDFGVRMVITGEMMSAVGSCTAAAREYKLFGVVYHHGSHAAGGHYTATTHHHSLQSWLVHDDDKVFGQEDKAVLKHLPGRSAYLLFYKRAN